MSPCSSTRVSEGYSHPILSMVSFDTMPTRSSIKVSSSSPQIAKSVADATSRISEIPLTINGKNSAAVALGRLGGLKGGQARASVLSPERRREIARLAAESRWNKKP